MSILKQVSTYFQVGDTGDDEPPLPPNPFEGTTVVIQEAQDEPDSWANSDPLRFQIIKEWVQDQEVPATLASRFVEQWGNKLREGDRFPDIFDLTGNPDFMNGIQSLRNYTTIAFPNAFKVQMPDGTVKAYQNSLTDGLRELPMFPSRGFGSAATWEQNLPVYTLDQFQGIMQAVQGQRRGGGGGGGGASRADLVMDRNQLKRGARDLWRRYLLDEPANVDRLVDDYVADATNFWKSKGGRRDFETWMMDRIENSQRGRILYAKKPEGMTMDQHLAQFTNVVSQVGLSGQTGQDATLRGLQSGAEAAPFAEQLGRSREVMSQQQGGFSQKFANQISQLGIRGT